MTAPVVRLVPAAGRVPVHDLDAEAAVLSAVMLDGDALALVSEELRPEHFYSDANRRIFSAALDLAAEGKPVDSCTIAGALRGAGRLNEIGGPSYLAQITDATPSVANVLAHASTVVELARQRGVVALAHHVVAEGYGDVGPVDAWIERVEGKLFDLARRDVARHSALVRQDIPAMFEALTLAATRGGRAGISTGLERLDAKTAGLHLGEVLVIAARPGMGKTALGLDIAVTVASDKTVGGLTEPGLGVCVFSLEMPREQVAMRMIFAEARVDIMRGKQGFLQPDDWSRLTEAATYIAGLPIYVDDTAAIDLMRVRSKIRKASAELGRTVDSTGKPRRVAVVVIDYLQLMGGNRQRGDNREQEISAITGGLKQLAKDLKVAVVLLAQLNRAVESRSAKDRRPQLSDLRESGAIEQDADTVLFIYRDEYYNPQSDCKGIAELLIAKQRNGPAPVRAIVRFNAAATRFDNIDPGCYIDDEET